jgi:hypothetical protein
MTIIEHAARERLRILAAIVEGCRVDGLPVPTVIAATSHGAHIHLQDRDDVLRWSSVDRTAGPPDERHRPPEGGHPHGHLVVGNSVTYLGHRITFHTSVDVHTDDGSGEGGPERG